MPSQWSQTLMSSTVHDLGSLAWLRVLNMLICARASFDCCTDVGCP